MGLVGISRMNLKPDQCLPDLTFGHFGSGRLDDNALIPPMSGTAIG